MQASVYLIAFAAFKIRRTCVILATATPILLAVRNISTNIICNLIYYCWPVPFRSRPRVYSPGSFIFMSATHERSHVISKNDIFLQFSLTSLFQHFVHCRAPLCIHHKDFHVRCLETFRSGAHRGERRKITQKESQAFLDFTDKKTKKWKWYFYCKSWHLFARSLSPALSLFA